MRTTARAIVVKDDALLVMHRKKFGNEYYSLVGGGVDYAETTEQALYREVQEETSLTISNHRLVIIEDAGKMYGVQYIYLCDYESGELALSPDSMEASISAAGQNVYEPEWLPLAKLAEANLLPEELKQTLINGLAHGFPPEPIALTVEE
jgi:8-oxo-dGTP diphosphatase